jgi:hypothetical protein
MYDPQVLDEIQTLRVYDVPGSNAKPDEEEKVLPETFDEAIQTAKINEMNVEQKHANGIETSQTDDVQIGPEDESTGNVLRFLLLITLVGALNHENLNSEQVRGTLLAIAVFVALMAYHKNST